MKDTVRVNFEFPKEHYPYLKLVCAEKGMSIREFASRLIIKAIEKEEDRILGKRANERLKEMDESENVPFDEAMKQAGWDDEEV